MYKKALRAAWAEIDLTALEMNIRNIRLRAGAHVNVIGVIKADAYGHGSVRCAEVLRECGVTKFAVATLSEAITLRQAGANEEILILGLTPNMYADVIAEYDLSPVFVTYENAKAFNDAAAGMDKIVKGYIAADTGMGRIGWRPDEIDQALSDLTRAAVLPYFKIEGAITHFAESDGTDLEYTYDQLENFIKFMNALEAAGIQLNEKTCANSAAIMRLPQAYFTAVRPGIILYGLYPSHDVEKELLALEPVMSVRANILYLKTVPGGTDVSYGRKYTSPGTAKIATIGIGYADGLPRQYSEAGKVIVNGIMCPIAGRICMDQFMVDVTNVPDVREGDEVTILGSSGGLTITADDIADACGTINYQIACGLGQRLPKVYVK
ncbi:MAG: alanine racemase [Eubacterium sp.]|nr:alanine racemase [Eubacterium sp.]